MNNGKMGEDPSVRYAVIVPLYNSASTIEGCLNGLAQQQVEPKLFEVIIIDDGSTDASVRVVEAWATQHPELPVRLIAQQHSGMAAARNLGAANTVAPILLFTDADCVPDPTWVATLGAAFADPTVVGARGVVATNQAGLMPQFVQAEYEDRYDHITQRPQIDFIDNYSAGYRRDIFLLNSGFDANFAACEDQELSFRLAEKGYRMVFIPQAQVTHLHDANVGAYARRKAIMGFWKAPLTRLHPERMVEDTHTPQVLKLQIVTASFFVCLAIPALLGLLWPALEWLSMVEAVLLGIFLASSLPFLLKLAQRSWTLALTGPFMLAVRALALGCGYLAGSIHYAGALPGARAPVIPGWKRVIKRTVDIAGALVGLAIAIPLVAIAAIAIKFDSPGPVFYWQVRIGENGRPFRIVKLRSMVVGAEQLVEQLVDVQRLAAEPAFKLADDPRVTRVGRVLRRTSIDEAPQFWNVLKGDMSLVGPRPEEERIVKLYTDVHRKRLAVKPGLTGPMQVYGRGNLPFSERLKLEVEYIDHFSLWNDFSLILRTFPAILNGKGAH